MTESTEQRQRTSWRPILPVPDDAPQARLVHPVRGEPLHTHPYYDIEGKLLGYVCRFMRSAGGIHTLTLTWCVNEVDQHTAWKWIQFRKLRPLYGAQRLNESSAGIVMVVADELVVDQMHLRKATYGIAEDPFAAYTFVSWTGGRAKLGEVDFSPLKGRVCSIWLPHSAERFKVAKGDPQSGDLLPIEKQPWRVAARLLKDTLVAFGAIPISLVEAPTTEELPDRWDPVAALNGGWDFKRLGMWFHEHFATAAEVDEARRIAAGAAGTSTPLKASPSDPDWMRSLMRKEDSGRLLPELHNVRKILSHHEKWRGVIYLDEFSHSVIKAKPPPFDGGDAGEWLDTDDSMTSDWLAEHCGIQKLRTTLVGEAVQTVAKLAAKNPLVDYLKGLRWDGKPRLNTWLRELLNAGPFNPEMSVQEIQRLDDYLRIVGRKWLLGAVTRALRPGCKFDYVLILEGQQGLGKSSAISILGGEWTMDTPFSLGDKEGMETIRGMWIVEIAELDSFNKAESTLAKSFFSRTKDRFRLPYGKRSSTFKRSSVFAGTTNEDEYFRDPTGNRRYWPVHCDRKGYDRAALTAARDQLLAEAIAAVQAGEQIWPSRQEETLIREQQRRREVLDPWVSTIARWLNTANASGERPGDVTPITRDWILREALQIEKSRLDERGMATRVGKAMHRLGYHRVEDKSHPERFRYEKRQDDEEGDQ